MDGQKIKSFDIDIEPNTNPSFLFALSPDGKFLTYYGKYGVYVLETETGSKIKTLDFTDFTRAQAGMIDIDGSRKYAVAEISSFGRVAIYDLVTGDALRTLNSECCAILSFAFAPDQKTAATVDDGPNLVLWDLQSGKAVYNGTLNDYKGDPIAFSPDGTSLFFIKEFEGEVLEFVFATGETLWHETDNYGYIRVRPYTNEDVHFNPLGHLVMLGFEDAHPFFEDVKTGSKIVIPFQAIADADFEVKFAFSHDGRFLSTGVHDGILVWHLQTLKIVSTLLGHELRGGDGWSGTIMSLIGSPQSNLPGIHRRGLDDTSLEHRIRH